MKNSLMQWDGAAQWYDQNMGEMGDELNATIIRPLVFEMLGDITGKSILDAGCGSGYVAAELARHAKTVVGTDFSQNFITLCKEKYNDRDNLKFAVQDVERPFQCIDESFDVIICKMVLQYVQDTQPFASEAMRILKPGGELMVIVDHPFRAAYFNSKQNQGEAVHGTELFSSEPKMKTGLWGKTELTWYARTTSQYVESFVDKGLKLVEMREPLDQERQIPFSVLALKFSK
jgi:ubiquinone/menaquinone biosynthesis C-methylase UbiE